MQDPDRVTLRTGFIGGILLGAVFCLVVCMACITAVALVLAPPRQVILRLATAWAPATDTPTATLAPTATVPIRTPIPFASVTAEPGDTPGFRSPLATPTGMEGLQPTATRQVPGSPATLTPSVQPGDLRTPLPAGPPAGAEMVGEGVWRCPDPGDMLGAAFAGSLENTSYFPLHCLQVQGIAPDARICFLDQASAAAFGYELSPSCWR